MIRYKLADVDGVRRRWKQMKIFATPSGRASVEDLAIIALTGRYPQQRLVAVAELVARIKNEKATHTVLDRVPLLGEEQNKNSPQSVDGIDS